MTAAYNFNRLGAMESLNARPFTDLSHNADDLRAMQHVARRQFELLNGPDKLPDHPHPLKLDLYEPDGRHMRIVICDPQKLLSGQDLWLVGFFGQRRPGADRAPIETVDVTLRAEFPAYPEVVRDRKSTRLNSSHSRASRMPSSA